MEHPDELAEDEHLVPLLKQRFDQLIKCVHLAGLYVAPDEAWVAADLPQTGQRGQHVHLALGDSLLLDRLHDLLAAALQLGEVEFTLLLG